jgi:hypothetical protein
MNLIVLGTRRELFVDDYLIDRMDGVSLELQKPERRETVLTFDAPWEDFTAEGLSLVAVGDALRLYYRAGVPDLAHEERCLLAIAESHDGGLTFTRPRYGLHAFQGSKDNNIVWAGNPPGIPAGIFLDTNPQADPRERFKGLQPGPMNNLASTLYAMCSADGIHWRRMREEPLVYPVQPGAFDSINTSFWDAVAGCYRCYTRENMRLSPTETRPPHVRIIQTATSPDYLHWTTPVSNHYADGEDQVQLYTNAALPCPGAEHLYVAFPNRFLEHRTLVPPHARTSGEMSWTTQGCNDALFMASRDGVHWTRYLDAWVRPGPDPRNWGQRNNYPLWGIARTSAMEWSMYISEHYMQPDVPGCLRRLAIRPHGFVSAHADYRGGELVTKPFLFEGRFLRLNYATSAAGQLQVEIQDAEGRPIEGFRLDDMDILFGDQLDAGIAWQGGADLGALAGTPIRLRFVLRDADLFALRFTHADEGVAQSYLVPWKLYRLDPLHAEIRVRPAPGKVSIDADLSDWDLTGAIELYPTATMQRDYCARLAMMHDAEALYVSGEVLDPHPLTNPMGLEGDVQNAWDGDALQIRLVGLGEDADAATHSIVLWYSAPAGTPAAYISYGATFDETRVNPAGLEGAYRLNVAGNGYTFEYRIPWSLLRGRRPTAGDRLTAHLQMHWGEARGPGIVCGVCDVRTQGGMAGPNPASWGRAVFE